MPTQTSTDLTQLSTWVKEAMDPDDPPETALAPASPIRSHRVLTENLARRVHHLMTTLKDRLATPWPSRATEVHTSHITPVDMRHSPPIHGDILWVPKTHRNRQPAGWCPCHHAARRSY
jgi:hypothetical protein